MLLTMPACAMFEPQREDPKMVALQREVRQIEKSSAFNQKAVEDIHERLDAFEDQVGEMNKSLVEQEKRLQALSAAYESQKSGAKAPGDQMKTPQPKVPKKPSVKKKTAASSRNIQQTYNKAYSAYLKQRYDEALALFKEFHKRHPKHDLADNAQYWVGEIYYDIEDYPNAILAFKEVVTKYGNQNKAPDALLKIGYSYMALDDPNNARIFLKRVIKNYPFSEAEAKARAKLKELENL
jgi:tol-pal system protein YbgF